MHDPFDTNPRLLKVWEALPGSQKLFLQSPIREVCFAGTRGPGKTDAMLFAFAQHCGRGFGDYWRGVIFRRNYKHLDDIINKSKRWFNRSAQKPRFLAGSNNLKWVWPTGEELLFRAFEEEDNYWDYHGHEYPFIGWEELTSWPGIGCYESMKSCNRSSFQPEPGRMPIPKIIRSSTNPYGVGHNWVKNYFIDPAPYGNVISDSNGNKRCALFGSIKENPFLDEDYVRMMHGLTDENKKKAWLYGSWDITSGGIFDDLWSASKHILKPFKIPSSWRVDRSHDWGSSKPFSTGWWAESDGTIAQMSDGKERYFPRGTLFRIAEDYGMEDNQPNVGLRLPSRAVAKRILQREKELKRTIVATHIYSGPADSAIYAVQDDKSIAQNMEEEGVFWVPADKRAGSRKNGWELMRDRLHATAHDDNERPGFYVFNTCKNFIRTVPSLPRDGRDIDDVDTEAEDHIADDTRYRVLASDFRVTQKPISGV